MGVTSVTQIQNSALIKLGADLINSEDDENKRARLVKEQYPKVRDDLLRAHPWKFATTRINLSPIDPKPANFFDYDNVFQLPADCLRVIGTSLCDTEQWTVEDRYFLCNNESAPIIKYIKQVTNVSKFDDNFCEVLAWAIAADIAYALTQNVARETSARASYKDQLTTARSFNAQQGSGPRVAADGFVNSRRY